MRVRALCSFAPADAPPFCEGDEREVTAAQEADYAPHVERVGGPLSRVADCPDAPEVPALAAAAPKAKRSRKK